MYFLFENQGSQWAPKFLDALENTGINSTFVLEIRQAAHEMKDEDFTKQKFGNFAYSFAFFSYSSFITFLF